MAEDEIVSVTNSTDMNLSKLQEIVKDKEVWRVAVHGVTKSDCDQVIEQQLKSE